MSVKIEQKKDKSQEWLEWRNTGIGSSDAPIIMGVSEWCTPYQLWEQKTGKVKRDQETSYIQDKGNKCEEFARAQYELRNGCEMQARQGQHAEHRFLLASADGFSEELQKGAEFKLASKEDHANILNGIIPQKYFPQVQHQMLVFGVKQWDYCSYHCPKGTPLEEGDLRILTVQADIDWMISYLSHATYFWKCVQDDTPPELTDKDARLIKDKKLVELAEKYVAELRKLDVLAGEVELLKEQLKTAAKDLPRAMFGDTGVTVRRSWRKGNVKYADVPELLGVDLEPYRGPSIQTTTVDVPKPKKGK